MDISTLKLPSRTNVREAPAVSRSFFTIESAVNVNYDTTEGEPFERPPEENASVLELAAPTTFPSIIPSPSSSVKSYSLETDNNSFLTPLEIALREKDKFLRSLQEPRYVKPLSGEEIGSLFQDFYHSLKYKVNYAIKTQPVPLRLTEDLKNSASRVNSRSRSNSMWSEANASEILEAIEQRLTSELYSKLFYNNYGGDKEYSQRFQERLEVLSTHPELIEKLDLRIADDLGDRLRLAAEEFCLIDAVDFPLAKLQHLLSAHRIIVEALEKEHASADLLLPAFVYSLIVSQLHDVWLNFLFIRRFRRFEALQGEYAYCLTNFEAALRFLQNTTFTDCEDNELALFSAPLPPPIVRLRSRSRSSSQILRQSMLGQIGATVSTTIGNGYRRFLSQMTQGEFILPDIRSGSCADARPDQGNVPEQPPVIIQRFQHADVDSMTIGDVRLLLSEYNKLAQYVLSQKKNQST